MDKIVSYSNTIKIVLQEFVDYISGSPSSSDCVLVSDDAHHVYAVFDLGWENGRRIQVMAVLIRLVNGKVYVEDDNTDYGFVDRLLDAGIPAKDMVLAWHPPKMRPHTEFALA